MRSPVALPKPCHCEPVRRLAWQSVPPRISCIFLRRAGCPHPAADKHSTPQTLSLRAHSAVAIRPPFFVASVGDGVLDDPHAQPPCHAIGAGSYPARSAAPSLIPCRAAPMCAAARPRIAPLALRRGGLPCPPVALPKPCHCEPARTLVWQSVPPLRRTPVIWKNGFPRRFAPRNDIFIIPPRPP